MNLWRGVFLAFITLGILTAATEALADTALVLPKNVYYFQAKYYHYFPITERYNHDGDSEPLATDLSNKELNSVVFPPLAQLDPFVGGNASIGRSDVDFEYKINNFEFYFYYGLTDKLSLGVMIPYFFLRNDVDASVDTTTANVGKKALRQRGSPGAHLGVSVKNTRAVGFYERLGFRELVRVAPISVRSSRPMRAM